MSNKTPFEIRLDLLQMAKEYMDKAQSIQVEFAKDAYYRSVELGTFTAQEAKKHIESLVPTPYSLEEMMKKATELYTFVSKRD